MSKRLVIILGPHAVGKMTVGQALARMTDLRLFHNHMSIELTRKLFDHTEPEWRELNLSIRRKVFELFATGDFSGMVFTYMCDFDDPNEFEYLQGIIDLFEKNGAKAHVVELYADFDVRIERNKSENRLLHKESKRDIAWSEAEMIKTSQNHRLNSFDGEKLPFSSYFKLDNTNISPDSAAIIIKEHFDLGGLYDI